jgi:hypothetical protein
MRDGYGLFCQRLGARSACVCILLRVKAQLCGALDSSCAGRADLVAGVRVDAWQALALQDL